MHILRKYVVDVCSKFLVCFCRWCLKAVIAVAVNVALMRPAIQTSTLGTLVASFAVDSNLSTRSCTSTISTVQPWWSVDLGTAMDVARVCVISDDYLTYGQPSCRSHKLLTNTRWAKN